MFTFEGIAASIRNFIHWSQLISVFVALLGGVTTAQPLLAQDHTMDDDHAPAKLVQMVQDATRKYFNVNDARKAGYGPFWDASPARITGRWACTTSMARC